MIPRLLTYFRPLYLGCEIISLHQRPVSPTMDTPLINAVECRFCSRKFASKSTYGRHLDSKRADALHPAEEVDALRKNVVRRGEPRVVDPTKQERDRLAKQEAARSYNLKVDVKERNKKRRKDRDVRIKSNLDAYACFLSKLAKGNVKEPTTFLEMVAVYLPMSNWPKFGDFPAESELQKVLAVLVGRSAAESVFPAWADWKNFDGDKVKMWQETSDKVLREALGETSVHEIVNCEAMVKEKCKVGVESYSQGDIFELLMSGDER